MSWHFMLALAVVFLPSVLTIDYSDLESVGVSCPERDSCNYMTHVPTPTPFDDRNCECDIECSIYNDCCIDSSRVSSGNRIRVSNTAKCLPFGMVNTTGAYMVNKCRRDYNDSQEVKRQCERANSLSDPLVAVPATDAANRITYKNGYCAECNGAIPTHLSSWVIHLSCDSVVQAFNVTESYILNNLEYSASTNKWGVNYWDENANTLDFYTCDLVFEMPSYLFNYIRLCRYDVISTCPPTWKRRTVRRMCESYMAVAFHNNNVYRNPHCALCNDVDVDELACNRGIHSRKKQPMSFALLLDVNRSDGDIVGVSDQNSSSCASNQKYDPFMKRCRTLGCALPGYRLSNGKCVRG